MQLTKAAVILWIIGCLLLSNPLAMAEERISDNYCIISFKFVCAVSSNSRIELIVFQQF